VEIKCKGTNIHI